MNGRGFQNEAGIQGLVKRAPDAVESDHSKAVYWVSPSEKNVNLLGKEGVGGFRNPGPPPLFFFFFFF